MEDHGSQQALGALLELDLSVADTGELAAASRSVARLQSFVDHAKVQINRRTRQLAEHGDTSSNHVLLDEGRLTGRDARQTGERDRVCETLPAFDDALASGACTAAHLDALAHHTKGLTDEERAELPHVVDDLIANAESQPAALFDRTSKAIIDRIRDGHRRGTDAAELDRQRTASRVKRWTDRDTGMKQTLISLDPLRDESLWKAIDHHLATIRQEPANKERPYHELQVEAVLVSIGTGPTTTRLPEIVIHVDHQSACHGRHADTLCETEDGTPVPISTVQRLCCEAILQAVIVNPDGTIDQLCEELRTASRKQRRMLAAMYRTCAHPHCQVPVSRCRIHHVEWFTSGGTTVLANLLPLCETHHHLVHEGGWQLTIDPQRRVTWHRPDGTIWHTDNGPDRTGRTVGRPPPERRATAPPPTTASPPSPPDGHPPRPPGERRDHPRPTRRSRPRAADQPTLC